LVDPGRISRQQAVKIVNPRHRLAAELQEHIACHKTIALGQAAGKNSAILQTALPRFETIALQ
jgi:hypothetical protein